MDADDRGPADTADHHLALTTDEAIELLAFLLASAHSCLFDPPGYGTYRLAAAAERLAGNWSKRAGGELAEYLRDLARTVPEHVDDPMGYAAETEAYLNNLIADLAREVERRRERNVDA